MYLKIKFFFRSIAAQNRSPAKNHNGRDNTESIDMEMSDEDFDAMPDFQSNYIVLFLFFRFQVKKH